MVLVQVEVSFNSSTFNSLYSVYDNADISSLEFQFIITFLIILNELVCRDITNCTVN